MDRAGLSAQQIADQLGHSKVPMTQDRYLGRQAIGKESAEALERAHRVASSDEDGGVSAG
jgi:integrase